MKQCANDENNVTSSKINLQVTSKEEFCKFAEYHTC